MNSGLKIFFTILIVLVLVLALPVMQTLTLLRITVMHPAFFGRAMSAAYEAAYDVGVDELSKVIYRQTEGISPETADRLAQAIRATLPPEDVTTFFEQAVPQVVDYMLYGGEMPEIDYSRIVDGAKEAFWDSQVFQDMLAEQIESGLDENGWAGGGIDYATVQDEAESLLDSTLDDMRFSDYYTSETEAQAREVIENAVRSGIESGEVDLSELPFPDAMDAIPMDDALSMLPFSSGWSIEGRSDFIDVMAAVHYGMSIFRIAFWLGWILILVLLGLLCLVWIKRPSAFMNVAGGLLVADGIPVLLFSISCWFTGAWFVPMSRWGHWDIPVRYAVAIRDTIITITRPFARISLIAGVLILVTGIVLLVVAPVVRKKEKAKEQIAA
jgi:hypothetical protein